MARGHREKFESSDNSLTAGPFPTKIPDEGPGPEHIDWATRAALRKKERFDEEGEFDDDD